jgi:hypothetical protein
MTKWTAPWDATLRVTAVCGLAALLLLSGVVRPAASSLLARPQTAVTQTLQKKAQRSKIAKPIELQEDA